MSSRAEYMRVWRANNREHIREYQRTYLRQHPMPPAGAANKKAWTVANRERVNAQSRAWYHRNKEQALAGVRRQQAKKKAAMCGCCAPWSFKFMYQQAKSLRMEVDHVQPLSKDGKHCLRNLQLLDQHDNRVKHARWSPQ